MSALFTPFRVGSLELRNRIVIAPMCQYSAVEGCATDWHTVHLGSLALSGAGLLTLEATAVSPEGRISPDDLGLWSDDTEEALARVLKIVRRYSNIPIAIQLAHAGRKASTRVPWKGGAQIRPDEPNGWQTVAPSALPFAVDQLSPRELNHDGLTSVRNAFAVSELKSLVNSNQPVTFVDVRNPNPWERSDSKIKGAIRIDPKELPIRSSCPSDHLLAFY